MAKRPRTPAQLPWDQDPKIMDRVNLVWEMYLKRVPYQEIAKRIAAIIDEAGEPIYGTISYNTVREDVRRGRATLHTTFTEFVKEQTEELVGLRNLIIQKTIRAWDELEALQDAQVLKGETKDGEPIYVTESPTAVARAKADLCRALSATTSDLERLLGLRQERGGDVNIDRVAILRFEGRKALPAPKEE